MSKSVNEQNRQAFIERVQKTKYCRINAYKRCKDWKDFLIFLSFVYNMCLIVVSVLSISLFKECYPLSVVITLLSVIVFAISLFASSLDYSRKANEYCRCYETLDELINDAQSATDDDEFKRIESKYHTIINFSINHEECDYNRFKYEFPDGPNSFLTMDDGTKRTIEEAKAVAESCRVFTAKKYKKYKAKTGIIKTFLTLVIFYPLYLLFLCIFRGSIKK